MSADDDAITLAEITIVGDPEAQPRTAGDWWCQGFVTGWNVPDSTPERPLMIKDDLANTFQEGFEAGRREARAAIEEYSGPAVEPDRGGVSADEAERRWREAWEEFLNRREDPHLDPSELRFGVVE